MKKLIYSFTIFAAIAGLFVIAACTDIAEPIAVSVSPTPAPTAAPKSDGQDARSRDNYKENHIKGAISIPFSSTDNFDSLPKGKKIIVYCS